MIEDGDLLQFALPRLGEAASDPCRVPPGKDPFISCPGYEYDEGECALDYTMYRTTGDVDDIGWICRHFDNEEPEERTPEVLQPSEPFDWSEISDATLGLVRAGLWLGLLAAAFAVFALLLGSVERPTGLEGRAAPRRRRRRSAHFRRSCFFYVIAGDRWVKFGITTNPHRRLRTHARSREFSRLLVLTEFPNAAIARQMERSALKWRNSRGMPRAPSSLDGYTETLPLHQLGDFLAFLRKRGIQ